MHSPAPAPYDSPGHAESPAMLQLLRFAIGNERYALRIDAVREILEVARTTPLPLMPDFVRGVMNLRGAVVPVIDLAARLGFAPAVVGRRSCVIVVDTSAGEDGTVHRTGLLVDAVYEVFDIAAHELEPVPRLGTRIDATFIRSMTRARGQSTPELNLDTVLDQAALSALISAHEPLH